MSKDLRICCVCHGEHSYCPVCNPEDKKKPTWHFSYCSENCKSIYEVTSDYEDKKISANDAKKKLAKLDLSKLSNFGESYQKSINSINENATEKTVASKADKSANTENKNEYCKKSTVITEDK